MTFLDFVAQQLMGPPVSTGNRSTWHCPFHDDQHPSFCILPPHPAYKDRFRCWSCGAWGDEFDLLRHFYPREDYGARLERMRRLRVAYETRPTQTPSELSPRGRGASKVSGNGGFSPGVNLAIAELLEGRKRPINREGLRGLELAAKALEICARYGVKPEDLAERCNFELWVDDFAWRHIAKCDDPDCDWNFGDLCSVIKRRTVTGSMPSENGPGR